MTRQEMLTQIALALIGKSGVREWESIEIQTAIAQAAANIVNEMIVMALPDFLKVSTGTPLTIRNSGGSAAITLASLANGSSRQAVTLDLGANWAQRWRVDTDFELAATPTNGNAVNLWASYSDATGAGKANTTGTDAAYTGYSSNAEASLQQLELIGAHICTVQATSTVQKALAGVFFPKGRYLNLVVENRSGAAFHSTDTNQVITLTPLEESIVD
jgi:hypothetical protein